MRYIGCTKRLYLYQGFQQSKTTFCWICLFFTIFLLEKLKGGTSNRYQRYYDYLHAVSGTLLWSNTVAGSGERSFFFPYFYSTRYLYSEFQSFKSSGVQCIFYTQTQQRVKRKYRLKFAYKYSLLVLVPEKRHPVLYVCLFK